MNDETIPNRASENEPLAESTPGKRYFVDLWDDFDNEWADSFDLAFDTLEEAIEVCNRMQAELPRGQGSFGDHYGVIDGKTGFEVYCGWTGRLEPGRA